LSLSESAQHSGVETYNKQTTEPGAAKSVTTHFAPGHKVDSDTYRVICDSPKDREHADLCIQWRIAEAAETQIIWTVSGFLVLVGTLIAAGATARSAWKTVVTTEDATQRQLRAYIGHQPNGAYFEAEPRLIEIEGRKGHVLFPIGRVIYFEKNFGQTPARKVEMYIRIVPEGELPEGGYPRPRTHQMRPRSIYEICPSRTKYRKGCQRTNCVGAILSLWLYHLRRHFPKEVFAPLCLHLRSGSRHQRRR
jgi:hypothetical protein